MVSTGWLVAVAVLCYVIWSRQRPQKLDPFLHVPGAVPAVDAPSPPVPPVALPASSGVPAAGGGFAGKAIIAAAVAVPWVMLAHQSSRRPDSGGDDPPVGITLVGKFSGPDAAHDALVTACLVDSVADWITADSHKQKPRLDTGVKFHDLRSNTRDILTGGVSLGDKHPDAKAAIKEFLDNAAGDNGGSVDSAARSRWISAYRDIARAARIAAGVKLPAEAGR